jgi:hypothetical protein
MGLRSEKGCAGDAQQKLKTKNLTSRHTTHHTTPHQQTHNCLKIIKERKRKIGFGPQMGA